MEYRDETTKPDAPTRNLIRQGELVYFDTNVFDPSSGLSDSQIFSIKDISNGTFRLVFGIDCLEEALLGLDSDEPEALEHVRRILRWPDPRLVAKPVDELLPDDIVRYSKGRTLSPWLENPRLATVKKNLGDLRTLDLQQLKKGIRRADRRNSSKARSLRQ